jgi:hypothetical protein
MCVLTASAQSSMDNLYPENKLYYQTCSQRDSAFKQKKYWETIVFCHQIDTLPHFESCGNGLAFSRMHNALLRIACYDSLQNFKKVLEWGLALSFEQSVNGNCLRHYDALKKALRILHPNHQKELANALDSQPFKVVSKTIIYNQIGGKKNTYIRKCIPLKIYGYTVEIENYAILNEFEKPISEAAKKQFMSDFYQKTTFYKVVVLDEKPARR